MIQIPPVFDFGQISIGAAAIPNREHVYFRPVDNVNLAHFAVVLGRRNPDTTFTLLWDHFFWFGNKEIAAPSWVFLFTSQGDQNDSFMPGTNHPIYFYYWGKTHTLFHVKDIHPILIRIGGMMIAPK